MKRWSTLGDLSSRSLCATARVVRGTAARTCRRRPLNCDVRVGRRRRRTTTNDTKQKNASRGGRPSLLLLLLLLRRLPLHSTYLDQTYQAALPPPPFGLTEREQ